MRSNILVLADMEGCTGITDMKQYDICKKKMIEETERVIQVIEECGDAEIAVADCHNDGKNIIEYFSNKGYECYAHLWSIQDMKKYDCAMLVGFHPKNGEDGFCPHTLRADVEELFLGEKSIGEVELLINWLAGYGVPVVFVSGDEAVRRELVGYKCEFFATGEAGEGTFSQQAILSQLRPYIKKALDLLGKEKRGYDNSAIKVKLIGESYYKWLPRELFSIEYGMVIFQNTKKFIEILFDFCMFLNIAEEYQRLRMRYLGSIIKRSDVHVEKDQKGKELLYQKDWRALSDEEIDYLYGLLKVK